MIPWVNLDSAKLPDGSAWVEVRVCDPDKPRRVLRTIRVREVRGRVWNRRRKQWSEVKDGGGKATLKTVAGGSLTATAANGKIMLTDEKGGMSHVTIGDVLQSNGVIHVVDAVLLPA